MIKYIAGENIPRGHTISPSEEDGKLYMSDPSVAPYPHIIGVARCTIYKGDVILIEHDGYSDHVICSQGLSENKAN